MNAELESAKAALDAAEATLDAAYNDLDGPADLLAADISHWTPTEQQAIDKAAADYQTANAAYQTALYDAGQGIW